MKFVSRNGWMDINIYIYQTPSTIRDQIIVGGQKPWTVIWPISQYSRTHEETFLIFLKRFTSLFIKTRWYFRNSLKHAWAQSLHHYPKCPSCVPKKEGREGRVSTSVWVLFPFPLALINLFFFRLIIPKNLWLLMKINLKVL